ncbi:AAA family ATPase [Robiginitalea marina]|uniref:AAA family ATPase n=1 Tax=Robiginitalea marina TaxID=2954105 RepID=A0ABT1AZM2_9FLAO|nr:AAA family ATPase [Robiginitalea marina]MCO5725052.1 AAA family ATPase [Robiginitalea marina]
MPSATPKLILVFGLPGTGKTTFATALSARLGLEHLNTDRIRSELGKRRQYETSDKAFIYSQLLEKTRAALQQGRGMVLDGTFYLKAVREPFQALAHEYGVLAKWIEVCAGEETVRDRMSTPRPYSEADFGVYQKVKTAFEPLTEPFLRVYSDRDGMEEMLAKSLKYLNQ